MLVPSLVIIKVDVDLSTEGHNMAAGGGMVYWTLNQALRRFCDSKVI